MVCLKLYLNDICIVNSEKILICILSYLYLIFLLKIISYKIKIIFNNIYQ